MLKTIIIEDEKSAQRLLSMILKEYCPQVSLLGCAATLNGALKLIEHTNPDVIFLDINLKDCNAFDLLDLIDFRKYKIIYTTAYEEHALKAFKYWAVDYILKPCAPKEVIQALEKVKASDYDINILENLASIIPIGQRQKKLNLSTSSGIEIIHQSDILYLEADGTYCKVYTSEGKVIMSSKGLKELESRLPTSQFFRIHLSYLINLNHLRNYLKEDGGSVILSNGQSLPVSRRRKASLIEVLSLGSL